MITNYHPVDDPAPHPPSFWMSVARGFIPTELLCPKPVVGGAALCPNGV